MILRPIASQDDRLSIQHSDYDIRLSVVIQITSGQSSRRQRRFESPAGGRRNRDEFLAGVPQKQQRFFVLQIRRCLINRVENVSLGNEDIEQTIVVNVNE